MMVKVIIQCCNSFSKFQNTPKILVQFFLSQFSKILYLSKAISVEYLDFVKNKFIYLCFQFTCV